MMNWIVDDGLHALFHVLFSMLALIIIYPRRDKILHLFIFSIVMELVIDGAHFVNMAYTHNIFFLLEFPLALLFYAYVMRDGGVATFSVLLLANNFTHMFVDLVIEGGALPLYYPIMQVKYVADVAPSQIPNELAIWLLLILFMALYLRVSKFIRLQSPPPYHHGRTTS